MLPVYLSKQFALKYLNSQSLFNSFFFFYTPTSAQSHKYTHFLSSTDAFFMSCGWNDPEWSGCQRTPACNQIVLCCSVKFHLTSKMFFHTPLDLAFCWGSYSKNSELPAGYCALSNNKVGASEKGSFNCFQGNTYSLVVMQVFIHLMLFLPTEYC